MFKRLFLLDCMYVCAQYVPMIVISVKCKSRNKRHENKQSIV